MKSERRPCPGRPATSIVTEAIVPPVGAHVPYIDSDGLFGVVQESTPYGKSVRFDMARQERDAAIALVEATGDDWERSVIDAVIRETATRHPQGWSANDVRPLLPAAVRGSMIGARFLAAARRGEIKQLAWVRSDDPGTHGRPIALWIAVGGPACSDSAGEQ